MAEAVEEALGRVLLPHSHSKLRGINPRASHLPESQPPPASPRQDVDNEDEDEDEEDDDDVPFRKDLEDSDDEEALAMKAAKVQREAEEAAARAAAKKAAAEKAAEKDPAVARKALARPTP